MGDLEPPAVGVKQLLGQVLVSTHVCVRTHVHRSRVCVRLCTHDVRVHDVYMGGVCALND